MQNEFDRVRAVAALLAGLGCPWACGGGWALDHFLGRVTRTHKDIDVAILRRDPLMVQGYLHARGRTMEKAAHPQFDENHSDFERVPPSLDASRRVWLVAALARVHPGHVWLREVQGESRASGGARPPR
jgi:hypothetical protein